MISLREMAAKALALHRDTENRDMRDYLNLLRDNNRQYANDPSTPFTDMETARVRFLRRLYLNGKLTEWPDGR